MRANLEVCIVLAIFIVGIGSSGLPPRQDGAHSSDQLRAKASGHVLKAFLKGGALCTVGGTLTMANCPPLYQAINRGDVVDATIHGTNILAGMVATAVSTPAVMLPDMRKAKNFRQQAEELEQRHGAV